VPSSHPPNRQVVGEDDERTDLTNAEETKMRDYLDLETLTFRLQPGDRERRRSRCRQCRIPIARVTREGKETTINQDGTPHWRSCHPLVGRVRPRRVRWVSVDVVIEP
jgi:hypothetical protein